MGICTVDTQNLSAACARYCTKYCAKDARADDTFMLFSRGIGEAGLLRDFNGKSYIIDGREYPIPRQIWEKKICEWYQGFYLSFLRSMYLLEQMGSFISMLFSFGKIILRCVIVTLLIKHI